MFKTKLDVNVSEKIDILFYNLFQISYKDSCIFETNGFKYVKENNIYDGHLKQEVGI